MPAISWRSASAAVQSWRCRAALRPCMRVRTCAGTGSAGGAGGGEERIRWFTRRWYGATVVRFERYRGAAGADQKGEGRRMDTVTLKDLRLLISALAICEGAGGVGAIVTSRSVTTW